MWGGVGWGERSGICGVRDYGVGWGGAWRGGVSEVVCVV